MNNKIREVFIEILNTSKNNRQTSARPTNSQAVTNYEVNISKKRFRQEPQSEYDENNRRKGSNVSTNFKTGIVPFNVYVGNVHLHCKN